MWIKRPIKATELKGFGAAYFALSNKYNASDMVANSDKPATSRRRNRGKMCFSHFYVFGLKVLALDNPVICMDFLNIYWSILLASQSNGAFYVEAKSRPVLDTFQEWELGLYLTYSPYFVIF